jgi:hypothetical protein
MGVGGHIGPDLQGLLNNVDRGRRAAFYGEWQVKRDLKPSLPPAIESYK